MIVSLPEAIARYELKAKIDTLLIFIEKHERNNFIRDKAIEILDELEKIEERYPRKGGVIVKDLNKGE